MASDNAAAPVWLEREDRFCAALDAATLGIGEGSLPVEIDFKMGDLLENYAGRRVFVAVVEEIRLQESENAAGLSARQITDQAAAMTFLLQETAQSPDDVQNEFANDVLPLVRRPIVRSHHGKHAVAIYLDNTGMTLEEIVDISRGQLTYPQVRDVYLAVLDLMVRLHETRHLHLRLAPWSVRIFDQNAEDRFPKSFLQHAIGNVGFNDDTGILPSLSEDTFSESLGDEAAEHVNEFEDRGSTIVDLSPLGISATASPAAESSESEVEDEGAPAAPVVDEAPDFGAIFDGIDEFFGADAHIEMSTVIMGFSPPEMMGRSRAALSEAADIFSLGMLLYYLVAGETPPASVYTRHAPAVPARNFRPGFPPGMQVVISRATRPHPQDRYPDVHAMRSAFIDACDMIERRSAINAQTAPIMRLASDTHIGIGKKRRNPINQDHVFSATSDDGRFGFIMVADGVSTASFGSGDLASHALVVEAALAWEDMLPAYLMDEPIEESDLIQAVLNKANKRIVDYVNANFHPFRGSPHEVMGTTAVLGIVRDGVVTLATLGDSRVYLQRGAAMEQITIDHNLWTLSILEGVGADSALAMPHGDALARCLGTFVVQDGKLLAMSPQPDFFRFTICSGDTLLWTTDGLVDFAGANMLASEDNILAILLSEADPALACLELILLANRGGGGDNIGLAVSRFV